MGQGVRGLECADLKAGMEMELVLDTLFETDDQQTMTWKWAPTASLAGQGLKGGGNE